MLACAPIEDALQEAKSEGDVHTRRAAMASMHETRAWLRAKDELGRLPQFIADLQEQLQHAQAAREPETAAQAPVVAAQIRQAEQRLVRIQAQFGPLVQAMNELAEVGGDV